MKEANVVILGGGFGGLKAASMLSAFCNPSFHVTVIDTNTFTEFTPSVLRCLVEPDHCSRILSSTSYYQENYDRIVAFVQDITPSTVYYRRNFSDSAAIESIQYEYLIIALGCSYQSPIRPSRNMFHTMQSRIDEIHAHHSALMNARDVVIIGGGFVGVELAAEIAATKQNGGDIHLIASRSRLLERLPERVSKYAEDFLKKRNVKIWYDTKATKKTKKVDGHQDHLDSSVILMDSNGNRPYFELHGAIVFDCSGKGVANSKCMVNNFGPSLGPKGEIYVSGTLQIFDNQNMFAIGDICSIKRTQSHPVMVQESTAFLAIQQAYIAASNVWRLKLMELKRGSQVPLLKFPDDCFYGHGVPTVVNISLHKHDGIFVLGPLVLTGRITVFFKFFTEFLAVRVARAGVKSVWSRIFDLIEFATGSVANILS